MAKTVNQYGRLIFDHERFIKIKPFLKFIFHVVMTHTRKIKRDLYNANRVFLLNKCMRSRNSCEEGLSSSKAFVKEIEFKLLLLTV